MSSKNFPLSQHSREHGTMTKNGFGPLPLPIHKIRGSREQFIKTTKVFLKITSLEEKDAFVSPK
jgi:hypothetical protein